MCEIVKIYINEAKKQNFDNKTIKNHLQTYIHGIEIDENLYQNCIQNLQNLTKNIGKISWDITLGDAFLIEKFNNKMDFVVGNPPYVRIAKNNLLKNYNFSKSAMGDIYLAFFEIGLKMLNKNGILGYITPSSYFQSLSAKNMRKFFIEQNLLYKIVDLKYFKPFEAATYTAITILKNSQKQTEIFDYDTKNLKPIFKTKLSQKDFFINDKFYFSNQNFKEILQAKPTKICVKNGFATLADSFFIGDFETKFSIKIIKASTQKIQKCIFPYDKNGNLINYEILIQDEILKNYYKKYEEKLKNRSLENKNFWWGFGRSQAVKDVYKDKICINSLIKSTKDLKISFAKAGVGVYGGLYILNASLKSVENALKSGEFIEFIEFLGKYKNGGYYTFSSKDLNKFLDYKIGNE